MRDPYWLNLLIGLDQFVGTVFGIPADVTISAYVAWRWPDGRMMRFLDWIFGEGHCRKSYMSDYLNIVKYWS